MIRRAQRDMSAAEFAAALKRNGFKHDFLGWYIDTTGQVPNVLFGGVYHPKPFKLDRRATLARLMCDRQRHITKKELSA